MMDADTITLYIALGLAALLGLLVASGVRLRRFARPLAVLLVGALAGNLVFVAVIVLARLPLALGDYQSGAISAAEILPAAFFYFSWFPLLTPGFYLFGLLGGLAAVGLYTVVVQWRGLLE